MTWFDTFCFNGQHSLYIVFSTSMDSVFSWYVNGPLYLFEYLLVYLLNFLFLFGNKTNKSGLLILRATQSWWYVFLIIHMVPCYVRSWIQKIILNWKLRHIIGFNVTVFFFVGGVGGISVCLKHQCVYLRLEHFSYLSIMVLRWAKSECR